MTGEDWSIHPGQKKVVRNRPGNFFYHLPACISRMCMRIYSFCGFKIVEDEAFKQSIAFSRKNFFLFVSPLHTVDVSLVNYLFCIQLFHICMAF